MPCQRHIMESGESDGLGGNYEESHFYKDRIQKKNFTGGLSTINRIKNKRITSVSQRLTTYYIH